MEHFYLSEVVRTLQTTPVLALLLLQSCLVISCPIICAPKRRERKLYSNVGLAGEGRGGVSNSNDAPLLTIQLSRLRSLAVLSDIFALSAIVS